ncbi:hypothetical protein [Anaerorhabdus sp.]|uniref:hypothetical protein n=1 Tax=Anaerorhabdus sp. TaxID=1872524 RepID=UPI002FCC992D
MWLCYQNDFELLYYCMQKDEWALNALINKYTPYSRKIVKESLNGNLLLEMYRDDFVLEALVAITDSIHCFHIQNKCKFGTFVYYCAQRRVKTLLRHHLRMSDNHNLYSISLDTIRVDEENPFSTKVRSFEGCSNPVYYLEYKDASLRVREVIQNLSSLDKQVLDLYLVDCPYVKASKIIGQNEKNYDNRVQKVKKLIKASIYQDKDITKR